MKILLTGGSGFLGSALARYFHQKGHRLSLILRPDSRLERLPEIESTLDLGRCSTDAEIVSFLCSVQPEIVIHTACAYGRQGEPPVQLFDTNVRYGLLIMQLLLRAGRPLTFINTGTILNADVSPYALSKHQLVSWGRHIAQQSSGQLRFVNVLLQHMYGPRDDASKFPAHVLQACLRNDPELKLTSGEQRRDFIYIDDVVSAYGALVDRYNELETIVDIEVGTGVAPSIREFVETVHRLTSSNTKLLFGAIPYREKEAMLCQADISRMSTFGWRPLYSLEAGLKRTIEIESSE